MNKNSILVYSTEHGKMCPKCNKPIKLCICKKAKNPHKNGGVVRVRRETTGRKGKGVTTISDIPLSPAELKTLAKELKTKCGSGGTIKNGIIEIQGDHCEFIIFELKKRNWIVKRSGG